MRKAALSFIFLLAFACAAFAVPVANAGADFSAFVGETVYLDGTASSGYVTVSQTDGSWSTRWATGDSNYDIQNIVKGTHIYQSAGVYTATLTVKDASGASSTDTAIVTVTAVPTATGPNTQTLTDTGNVATNRTNLQNAVNTAAANSATNEIVVPAGFSANGYIDFPTRSSTNYVTIRVANADSNLPPKVRVSAASASLMFKIVANDPGTMGENYAVKLNRTSQYYRFIGMNIERAMGSAPLNTLMGLDTSVGVYTDQANHIIVDRCLFNGNGKPTVRGFEPEGRFWSLVNSAILDIKAVGYETKAIGYFDGEGPVGIINNRLEAASINFLVGGVDIANDIQIPKGLVFRGNYSWKDPAWAGTYGVKNLWELKYGHNNVCVGNVFENNYADAQQGEGILIKSTTQGGFSSPYNEVRYVDFRNNKVLNTRAGYNVVGVQYDTATPPNPPKGNHVRFYNNFWTQSPIVSNARGNLIIGPDQFQLIHNTFINISVTTQPAAFAHLDTDSAGNAASGLVILNNLSFEQTFYDAAFLGSISNNSAGLDLYAPGWTVLKNVFPGVASGPNPATNFYPATASFNTTNFNNAAGGDYSLKTASAYHNAATDGTDIGANMTTVNSATSTVIAGTWASGTRQVFTWANGLDPAY